MTISNEQLAVLLTGMARATLALHNAVSGQQTVSQSGIPVLQGLSGVHAHQPLTLETFYARILLQSFGTPGPDLAYLSAELDRLTA
ncbi:hypothetical protein ABL840_04970 [Variovorax sp. NFACC27]|uniref:hypothetical protein n=1 Tax=unclassified Variovorax TaxID=663243 RepID=UPI00089652F5|nr:hypothetical protein SAMN03159371_00127 [Variovorax sp. NFACC28]SEF72152.1 hypothetical protein SAMN03159365_00690 [Variovorax sp. NFACC29]SFB77099.1 hypothetical protein SAMN03159379_00689 [Variovorax sp. NFACC26]SFG76732.1 hypothetical protein SAMN03159447_04812 [Variovorax sp. NFACC27]